MTAASQGPSRGERRAIVLVIDGCGAGASPDHADFGDSDKSNTLANVAKGVGGLELPSLARLGLGNITPIAGVPEDRNAIGLFGKLRELSNGKDTQTGHWEMMGIVSSQAFPYFPNGFPPEVIDKFIAETGCKGILCNEPASGTEVLDRLGPEHQKTGLPIVYTSADSVFQIAVHVETVPLATLYKWCEIARKILQGPYRVGRVIARPFDGQPGNYRRLQGDRRDYAVPPPAATFLDKARGGGRGVFGIGKIEDIFVGHGLTHAKHTGINREGLELTLQAIKNEVNYGSIKTTPQAPKDVQLIFTNLVDTDSMFGHRRDVKGYAGALQEIDQWLGKIIPAMQNDDLLIISSDHGNDPTMPGTDHTREDVPLLVYSPSFKSSDANILAKSDLGVRNGFTDIAATLSNWLDVPWQGEGKTVLPDLVHHR
jgi:phosphopentomutase